MLKSQVQENQNMASLKQFKAHVLELRFTFSFEYRYVVLSRGMQRWLIEYTQSAHRLPSEKTLRKTPCFLNSNNLVNKVLAWWTKCSSLTWFGFSLAQTGLTRLDFQTGLY